MSILVAQGFSMSSCSKLRFDENTIHKRGQREWKGESVQKWNEHFHGWESYDSLDKNVPCMEHEIRYSVEDFRKLRMKYLKGCGWWLVTRKTDKWESIWHQDTSHW